MYHVINPKTYFQSLPAYVRQTGFIFYVLLLFLHLFALLSLYVWMNISLTAKKHNHLWHRETIVHESKFYLHQLSKRLPTILAQCSLSTMALHGLAQQSIDWWKIHACSEKVNEIMYYYLVEALGQDPCGIVKNDINSVFISDYYRITLLALSDKNQTVKIILQMTQVIPVKSLLSCADKQHYVSQGLQKWREI